MRIAVLVSGALNSKWRHDSRHDNRPELLNNIRLREKFPDADFYYASWKGYENDFKHLFPNEECTFYDEPVMNYHPYKDIPKAQHISEFYETTMKWAAKGGEERFEWTIHHTKQILIHMWLVDQIKDKYDIIVRARFDTLIYKDADFSSYVKDTLDNYRANCFGAYGSAAFENIYELNPKKGTYNYRWLDRYADFLIIHPTNFSNKTFVDALHKDKILHAGEFGWYQALNHNKPKHRNHFGWVFANKFLTPEQIK